MKDLLPEVTTQLNEVLRGLRFFVPELYLAALFILVLVTDLLFGKRSAKLCRAVATGGMMIVIVQVISQKLSLNANDTARFFSGMLMLHHTGIVFKLIIDVLALMLLFYFAWDKKLASHKKGLSDLYTIVIGSVLGLHLMTMAVNLLSIYLAIEMVSIASYLLAAYRTDNAKSTEAGLKYVLFGATASAVMLYGISLVYAFCGSLDIFSREMQEGLIQVNPVSVSFALTLILLGIGFKLSLVPAHFYVPDVYEGAATPVTAYLSTLPKIAAFALLINFITPFITSSGMYINWAGLNFRLVLSAVGIATMVVGNFAAVWQNSVKRMLAYSGIAHTGFALMAVVTFSGQGLTALTYYLLVYGLANIAALMLANYFENNEGITNISDYKGLGFKYPLASVAFVIILISLTGIPISAGFTGKVVVFSAVYGVYQQTHDIWLMGMLITGAVTTVVGLFYYIKIPLNLFLKRVEITPNENLQSRNLVIFSSVVALLLIIFGLIPDKLINLL
ncbi:MULTISPECIES: NADH-quinone oxidoreductase subunit N [unclassified Mucilaginibacter]|uniref:NADH-quinone oxidoreductase subunit N n=1 Tax=unclassified Mucilaginibacter TaxID=2617802 RepID=UPI002AC9D0D8|nr:MULTISPECIES: NADH-quinone oxidoreductase subunit N [unclassified Mucilaginibacter]MEB0261492.1 NADH-quinone oxidoreductase subunit N [Mucilaginibacter sp. 10I4]MEB0276922.1 NADH-quinone oxidoreductase subunit N [Mucilaginibacter sp. 10B2]MEB0300758.1 NADH-quinone oxidoreductase subunit N [Mucilaginibacter sp. 5C4]WPX25022.1 NADH-quinone oxidoreductase subunit N [Mucilaginibacter sp. 5C4]